MTLQELLETIVQRGLLTPSRIPPMGTAVKQYAAILGVDAVHCTPEIYHLPPKALIVLIDTKGPTTLGASARRNLKNNLRWLLRQGEALHVIAPLNNPLQSWDNGRRIGTGWTPNRGEQPSAHESPYALRPLPETLDTEFQEFSAWSMASYAPDRPARIQKRQQTVSMYQETLEYIAGFAHRIEQMPVETITLHTLTDPALVTRFTRWWIARRGKVTRSIHNHVMHVRGIAQYWFKDELRTAGLRQIRAELSHPEAIHDKDARWVSLKELEAAGCSQYPLNAKRLQENKRSEQIATQLSRRQRFPMTLNSNGKFTALCVAQSLMLRLLVRIPLRQRNLREMQLNRNLRRLPDGTWQLTFKRDELKIGWRNGREHRITYSFPTDLQDLLEEWLDTWRPLLLGDSSAKEVFINTLGRPFSAQACRRVIGKTTWKFTGIAVNPHMIRDIFATEYIKATKDIAGAAYMLGNTVAVVMKHYAHLLDADAERQARTWLQSQLT
jgi:Phage integrase family